MVLSPITKKKLEYFEVDIKIIKFVIDIFNSIL